jgi:hypothetical protein
MTRHGLFAILALTGALTIPDPTLARPSFRPAFTTGPFRIVLPTGRPHLSGAARFHGSAMMPKPHLVPRPVVRTAKAGLEPFRRHQHRFRGTVYPITVGGDESYYGTPYDPSDIPVYGPVAEADDAAAPMLTAQPYPVAVAQRGCRAQHVLVPNAGRAGESEITIVRC